MVDIKNRVNALKLEFAGHRVRNQDSRWSKKLYYLEITYRREARGKENKNFKKEPYAQERMQ